MCELSACMQFFNPLRTFSSMNTDLIQTSSPFRDQEMKQQNESDFLLEVGFNMSIEWD